ncbi:MAG: GAF domain-containing protein [Myxococcales bacterium]|nr:GAF domain-containing protein [Myxococcales bacterium]
MIFRIYVPALEPDGVSMTIDVEATNWMMALRLGLDEIGADRDLARRAVCDIKPDKTIHVMEPVQGRVFVLRELPDLDRDPQRAVTERFATSSLRLVDGGRPRRQTAAGVQLDPDRVPTRRIPIEELERELLRPIARGAAVASVARAEPADAVDVELELDYPLDEADLERYFEVSDADRAVANGPSGPRFGTVDPSGAVTHQKLDAVSRVLSRAPLDSHGASEASALSDVVVDLPGWESVTPETEARVQRGMDSLTMAAANVGEALELALDLITSAVPSEAGWMMLSEPSGKDLYFAAAVGPKADEVKKFKLPIGKGIAGFCALNAVSLTLADVERDPRFQTTLSKEIGYEIRSVACAPVQHEGRVYGALQVMNHTERPEFTTAELDLVTYVARRTAEFLAQHTV